MVSKRRLCRIDLVANKPSTVTVFSPKKMGQLLSHIDAQMEAAENQYQSHLQQVHPSNRRNAANLIDYLVLRSLDLRLLQDALHAAGLSSLASSESHIRGQLNALLSWLQPDTGRQVNTFTYAASKKSLQQKVKGLFGETGQAQNSYIMVTLDGSNAHSLSTVITLLQSGMNIARINCAHDDANTWLGIIQLVEQATAATQLPCSIYMDLAGPKLRTVLKGKQHISIALHQQLVLCDEAHLNNGPKHAIGCTIPGIAALLKMNDVILFDDGLVEAKVVQPGELTVGIEITRISSKKLQIKAGKGINFPDTQLRFDSLTAYDLNCIPFIQQHAQMVGYSFVQSQQDLDLLDAAWEKGKKPHVILKIETREAVNQLPNLLLAALRAPHCGVMIARGDLAVEIGFERLSEIQEEILWICEAAHVPVIWATQVLENLQKTGVATRSEITDAAHAAQADVVMINKGSHTLEVLAMLKDIVQRSEGHHLKKRYLFRPLNIATRFFKEQEMQLNK